MAVESGVRIGLGERHCRRQVGRRWQGVMSGDGSGQRLRQACRVRTRRSAPVCRRRSEPDGSGRQAACHHRCLGGRRSRSPGGICRLRSARRSRSSRAGLRRAGGRASARAGGVDDLAGAAAQRRHAQRRSGVSRDDRAVARRAGGPPAKAGEACAQRGVAEPMCRTGWPALVVAPSGARCSWAGRVVEGPSAWTAAGPAMGDGLEPGADRPAPAARLPGRRDDAHQP